MAKRKHLDPNGNGSVQSKQDSPEFDEMRVPALGGIMEWKR
jgi:hypothetical protein